MNASVAIQVLPNVTDDEEVIRIVDEVIAYIKSFGLSTSVGPFETTIEGDYDQLMEIVAGCQKVAIAAGGCDQISTYVKIVYKPEGEVLSIEKKVTKHLAGIMSGGGTSGIYASVAVAGSSGICKGFSIDGGAYVDHAF